MKTPMEKLESQIYKKTKKKQRRSSTASSSCVQSIIAFEVILLPFKNKNNKRYVSQWFYCIAVDLADLWETEKRKQKIKKKRTDTHR